MSGRSRSIAAALIFASALCAGAWWSVRSHALIRTPVEVVQPAQPHAEPAPPPPIVRVPLPAGFFPGLASVDFSQAWARPGDPISYSLNFTNDGNDPSLVDQSVFVHFERVANNCPSIEFQDDHEPRLSTRMWEGGEAVRDGPRLIDVPVDAPEGSYAIHVGLFDPHGEQVRSLDLWPTYFRVSQEAPSSEDWQPKELPQEQVEQRRDALKLRLRKPVTLASANWTFAIDASCGAFLLEDLRSHVVWSSNAHADSFGRVRLVQGKRKLDVPIRRFDSLQLENGKLVGRCAPQALGSDSGVALEYVVEPIDDGRGMRLSCSSTSSGDWKVESVTILERAFPTSDGDDGYTVVPRWLGQLLTTDRGLPYDRFYALRDLTMSMGGAVKQGSALLLAWEDPDTVLGTHQSDKDSHFLAGRRTQSLSIELRGGRGSVDIFPLGKGDYVDIAQAYRRVVERSASSFRWADKKYCRPQLELVEGAAQFRCCCLIRTAPSTKWNASSQESVTMNYSFDEVERCARHWHDDLGIDRANVIVAGWNRMGYDNGYPDVLPASPECGGDEALAACSRSVQSLGYLFTLHDNYFDMYKDAPSFDAGMISRDELGELRKVGLWFGGQAYRVCSRAQLALAHRNLPRIRELFAPNAYFLDTTLTAALQRCCSAEHPVSEAEDRALRCELYDYAREQFGILGLEGATEWGIPEADYLEGILTHKTIHNPKWVVVPLFPIVYGDCLGQTALQSDMVGVTDAVKVLDLLLYGQVPSYSFDPHVYFEQDAAHALRVRPQIARFEQISTSTFRIRYRWDADAALDVDFNAYVHFIAPDAHAQGEIAFQADHKLPRPTSTWKAGDVVEFDGPVITIPKECQDQSLWDIQVGLVRGGRPYALFGADAHGAVTIGTLRRNGARLALESASGSRAKRCFARADQGFAARMCATDRMIKNTYEVLSAVNRLTSGRNMQAHRFLRADRSVEQSEFGDLRITVNYGEQPYELPNARLGQYGFLVESPSFVAFHATRYLSNEYPEGAMFTLTSLDGQPLASSGRVRVYHAFGDATVELQARNVEVEGASVIER